MANIRKEKLDRVITASCVSTSGKWQLLLCEHIVAGKFCFDVVAFNNQTRQSVSRHYRESPDDSVNRAEALRVYDEYREKLTAKPLEEESDERDPLSFINPD